MKNIVLIFISFIFTIGCYGQKIIYFNKDWNKCEKKQASYYRVIKKTGNNYLVKDMYISKKPQMIAICSTIEPTLIYNGKVTRYDENGFLVSIENYSEGKKCGLWTKINNITKDTTLVDYYLNGDFNYHLKNYGISAQEYFPPKYTGGVKEIKKLITENLKYPLEEKTNRTGGKLDVHFRIDTLGNVTNVEVIKGISKNIDEEGIRLIKLLNGWIPATENGKKISIAYAIPILFFPDNKFETEYKNQEAKKNIYIAFLDLNRNIVDSSTAAFYTVYDGSDTTQHSGTNETYLSTGILLSKADYIQNKWGQREEIITYYFDNTKVRSVHHTIEGKKNGECLVYYSNGKIKRRELYQSDTTIKGNSFTEEGKDTLYESIDERLSLFPGGEKALSDFIKQNIIYPKAARKKGIQGSVTINYIVDKYGNVKNVKVDNDANPLLEKEAIRVINSLPKFIPGYMRDQALSSVHTKEVVFLLK
jgi:TonB family protein